MRGSFTAALARAARLDQVTPFERLQNAIRDETEHVAARLLRAVEAAAEPERASAVFRELVERLTLRAKHGVHAAELEFLRRRSEALGCPGLSAALAEASSRLNQLDARVEWLVRGTPAERVAELDPRRDCDRIHHHLSSSFRAEARVVETLAINRVSTWESLALFLRSTREAERNPVGRFFDTYALFANYFEWGADSQRGARAVERINQIHGRYYLPNEGMKYVLLNTAFTWLDGIERVGHRPLTEVERSGFFHAYVRLGRAMNIRELSDDRDEMYGWFREANRRNASHAPLKTETFELFVKSSFGSAERELEAMLLAGRVAMDEHYRAALGYAEPSARERRAVRAALAALAAEKRPGAIYLRSLDRSPNRVEPARPSELGVSERSRHLPARGGAHPEGQTPIASLAEARAGRLEPIAWEEIRLHASDASLWVVIDGDVYDVTGFIAQHPGGAARLREWAGQDASAAFRAAGHGALTQVLRLNYRIGRVAP